MPQDYLQAAQTYISLGQDAISEMHEAAKMATVCFEVAGKCISDHERQAFNLLHEEALNMDCSYDFHEGRVA